MDQDFKSILAENNSILVVIQPEQYNQVAMDILSLISLEGGKIGYVSLNKLISQLLKAINLRKMETGKFFFVDCITKTVIASPERYPNCDYVPSPKDLTKTSIAITKMLRSFDPNYVFFDSVSSLLIYESTDTSSQFLHALVNKITAFGAKSVFTCLEGDKEDIVIKNLSMVIDKIVRV